MQIPTLYLTIAGEVFGFIFVVIVIYFFLQSRDKKKLLFYIEQLKEKVVELKQKVIENEEQSDATQELLEAIIEHVKTRYELTYGHEIGTETSTAENNSSEHFIFILGYQSLKAELSAIQNSRTADNTWEKITSQLGPLVDNFRLLPETEKTIESISAELEPNSPDMALSKAVSTAAIARGKSAEQTGSTEMSNVRRSEIERLKGQISSQFEEIFLLQSQLSQKAADGAGKISQDMNEGLESITRQLKDAELCITMMDAEIQTANEEILNLQDELDNIKTSNQPVDGSQFNDFSQQLGKKDDIIKRAMQENKEMMTLIEGMEKNSDEQTKQINELEAQLAQLGSN